jgi:hypothetical protein
LASAAGAECNLVLVFILAAVGTRLPVKGRLIHDELDFVPVADLLNNALGLQYLHILIPVEVVVF